MHEREIEIEKFEFAVLPYGSGNDLAQSLGFGAVAQACPQLNSLYETLSLLLNHTSPTTMNIWEILVKGDPNTIIEEPDGKNLA